MWSNHVLNDVDLKIMEAKSLIFVFFVAPAV